MLSEFFELVFIIPIFKIEFDNVDWLKKDFGSCWVNLVIE